MAMQSASFGQPIQVLSGQVDTGDAISVSGTIEILSGGSATGSTVGDTAAPTGDVENATSIVDGGQTIVISSGQVDIGDIVLAGGLLLVESRGTASGTTISAGGTELVSGGNDIGALIFGAQLVSRGLVSSGTVEAGGIETLFLAGVALKTTLSAGGMLVVSNGGAAVDAAVASGGTEQVAAGGSVAFATVALGGLEIVSAGGSASATAMAGGEQDVFGTVAGTILGAGTIDVFAGGVISAAMVSAGTLTVASGGTNVAAVVTGGTVNVLAGAVETGTTVSQGTEAIGAGGIASGSVLVAIAVNNPFASVTAIELVSSGGTAVGTMLSAQQGGGNASAAQIILSGATALGTQIVCLNDVSLGIDLLQIVSSAGTALGTTVSGANGFEFSSTVDAVGQIVSGGFTSGTRIIAAYTSGPGGGGAIQLVAAGGTASATTIEALFDGMVGPTVTAIQLISGAASRSERWSRRVRGAPLFFPTRRSATWRRSASPPVAWPATPRCRQHRALRSISWCRAVDARSSPASDATRPSMC